VATALYSFQTNNNLKQISGWIEFGLFVEFQMAWWLKYFGNWLSRKLLTISYENGKKDSYSIGKNNC
jgi:hypothetical protein